MKVIGSIVRIFSWGRPHEVALLDTTEYRIITNTNEYLGIIIHQDDFSIRFQGQGKKTVKILKSNITQMSVVPGNRDIAQPVYKSK